MKPFLTSVLYLRARLHPAASQMLGQKSAGWEMFGSLTVTNTILSPVLVSTTSFQRYSGTGMLSSASQTSLSLI